MAIPDSQTVAPNADTHPLVSSSHIALAAVLSVRWTVGKMSGAVSEMVTLTIASGIVGGINFPLRSQ